MGCHFLSYIVRRMDWYHVLCARCSQLLGLDLFRSTYSGKYWSTYVCLVAYSTYIFCVCLCVRAQACTNVPSSNVCMRITFVRNVFPFSLSFFFYFPILAFILLLYVSRGKHNYPLILYKNYVTIANNYNCKSFCRTCKFTEVSECSSQL